MFQKLKEKLKSSLSFFSKKVEEEVKAPSVHEAPKQQSAQELIEEAMEEPVAEVPIEKKPVEPREVMKKQVKEKIEPEQCETKEKVSAEVPEQQEKNYSVRRGSGCALPR